MVEKYGYTEECEGCRCTRARFSEARNRSEARITKATKGDEEGREKTQRIARQVQAQVEKTEKQVNARSNQPDHDTEDQGGQGSPEDEEMPNASGAGMTEQAEGADG